MIKTPHHLYLILTKRSQRALKFTQWFAKETAMVGGEIFPVLPHIWFGVTTENQEEANRRIPILLSIPAAKRFVSIEPMLGAIDFLGGPKVDWVICGGESGNGARPMHPDWVRSLRDQCKNSGTSFFFKQWGEWLPSYDFGERLEELIDTFPKCRIGKDYIFEDGTHMYKIGKKAAGSLLDGKHFKQYPEQNS
jgi:protein gp37